MKKIMNLFSPLILSAFVLINPVHATKAQMEFRNDLSKMGSLPISTKLEDVKTGKYRFAIGGRTIGEVEALIEKRKANKEYMPTLAELRVLKICNVVGDKISNYKNNNPEIVFVDPQTLDENIPDQKRMKELLEKDKDLRALKENINVTYHMKDNTLGGSTPTGFKKISLPEIFKTTNDIDRMLGSIK